MNPISAFFNWLLSLFGGVAMASPEDPGPVDLPGQVEDAIRTEIVENLNLPRNMTQALVKQSARETRNWKAPYFAGPQTDGKPPTFNLFNRHAGTGRGEWTHQTKYVSAGDADLRIYTDVYQSARDYVQLMQDPLFKWALIALKAGDAPGYFQALEDAGFNNHNGDYAAYARQWEQGVYT